MKTIKAFFFYGDNSAENEVAIELLNNLVENSPKETVVEVERLGDSDTFKPTILWETISFNGINEITRFCAFMKKENSEKNEIAERNFAEGIIGF